MRTLIGGGFTVSCADAESRRDESVEVAVSLRPRALSRRDDAGVTGVSATT